MMQMVVNRVPKTIRAVSVRRVAVSTRRGVLLLVSAMVLGIASCGPSTDVQNPPAPPQSKVTIAFDPPPVTSLPVNSTTEITAVVTDDPGNFGVDWSLSCNNAAKCGSLSALHSASGQPVTYTPPVTLPGNSLPVNIVAFAAADHTQNQVAPINITAFGNGLQGTFVFQAKGVDANFQPYQLAGVLVLDGNGGISAGEQVMNTVVGSLRTAINTTSNYFLDGDGRGAITLHTTDADGAPVTENFSFIVISSSRVLLAELDSPQSSVGSMDLQTSTAAPSGSYAFVMSGTDPFATPTAFGGVLNIDSPGSISGDGSLADQDYNATLTSCNSPKGLTGTVSNPDADRFGAVKFDLNGSNCFGAIQLTGYPIDGARFALIETDNNSSSGFSTSGTAISQGTARGTFTDASFSGTYVFGILGTDMSSGLSSSLVSVGLINPDGSGNLSTGVTDTFLMSDVQGLPLQVSSQYDGTYQIDTKGIGRVRATLKDFDPAPRPAYHPLLIFYLTGEGPALVLNSGGKDANYPSLGAGIAYPRAASRTFRGKYGVSFTQQNGSENDGTGRVVVDPASNPSLSGLVDDTNFGLGNPVTLTDHVGSQDSNGRIQGTFLGSPVRFYPIDSTQGFFVQTDLADEQLPSGQVALGYYATRTPICDGCP